MNRTDIGVIASKSKAFTAIMFWNYHDDDKTSPDADIELLIKGIPSGKAIITQYRIDKDHSNSYEVWKKMGSPQNPTQEQYAELEKAGMLQMYGNSFRGKVKNGVFQIETSIQRQGVGLLKIEWE